MLDFIKRILIFIIYLTLISCSRKEIKIGFSQCTGGEWREQMNRQMRSEVGFYDDTSIEIRNAGGNLEKQIADIHYFINNNVDLIIISPFEDKSLVKVFNTIDFKGIPILPVDRNISSNKHVSFVGASNTEVGKIAAQYTLKQLPKEGKNKVLHIRGYEKSSATEDRQSGFINELKEHTNVDVLVLEAGEDLDGTKLDKTKKIIHENRHLLNSVQVVYGFSDEITMIASDEAEKEHARNKINFIGVDGQLGYNKGLDAVKKNQLQATIVYPSGGDIAIETAMKIINKVPVQKYISLPLILIDSSNISSYYQQEVYIQSFQNKIELLQNKTSLTLNSVKKQRTLFIIIFMSTIFLFVFTLYKLSKNKSARLRDLEMQQNLEEKLFKQEQELVQIESHIVEKLQDENKEIELPDDLRDFKEKAEDMIAINYSNDNFSIQNLVEAFNISRMHLYRKFKQAYNDTPNNYLRKYRLKKALELIHQNNFSYSEIAYKVGFTSPAYFTKCFKEEFGHTPSDFNKL